MAKDIMDAIAEEEEREVEEADDLEEQAQEKEYADEGGENTAPTVSTRSKRGLELVCVKCGKRIPVKHFNLERKHCGKPMVLVDHESRQSYAFDLVNRIISSYRKKPRGTAAGKTKPSGTLRKPKRRAATRAAKRTAGGKKAEGKLRRKGTAGKARGARRQRKTVRRRT